MNTRHRSNANEPRMFQMMSGVTLLSAAVLALLVPRPAAAQEATERFIPIGQSPGVSGVLSYIGEIESRDAQANTVTVAGADGPRTFTLTDSTRIWIDRSSQQATNLIGEQDVLQVGRRIEVKFPNQELQDVAEWIKVAG